MELLQISGNSGLSFGLQVCGGHVAEGGFGAVPDEGVTGGTGEGSFKWKRILWGEGGRSFEAEIICEGLKN